MYHLRGIIAMKYFRFDECGTRMRIEDDHYYVYDNHIGRGPEFVNGVLRDYGITYNVRCTIDRLGKSANCYDSY